MVSQFVNTGQLYRFKDIQVVNSANDLIDIVLSKTQRKTPTVVHPQYDIKRIRAFYMRKVKYTQQIFHDKLIGIVEQFPKIDEIHPFYSDLMNVLYDKDHYKISLAHVNSIKNTIDTIAKEYIRLLKFADSLYKCKLLKKASIGRMCTFIKKLKDPLNYLEEIRKHLSRLPSINPYANTLILAGHPNVGKSTLMNVLSNSNVEVADWAFTTQSLYLGHFDYNFNRWQIIDTPGILDRPLSNRNTIEMSAITALAHITAAILFLIDISCQCGYTLEEQVELFKSLNPLLKNKPVVVILNKIDIITPDELSEENKNLLKSMGEGYTMIKFVGCSTLQKLNLDEAKNSACEMFISYRKQKRLLLGKSALDSNSFYVTNVQTNPNKPPAVLKVAKNKENSIEEKIITEKDLMELNGGAGTYNADTRKHWILDDDNWKYDIIPETFNGKNIADYIDQDIETKLAKLEKEEEEIEKAWDPTINEPGQAWHDAQKAMYEIMVESEAHKLLAKLKKSNNYGKSPNLIINTAKFRERLNLKGIAVEDILAKLKTVKIEDASDDNISLLESDQSDIDIEVEQNVKELPKKAFEVKSEKLKAFILARRKGKIGMLAKSKLFPSDRTMRGIGANPTAIYKAKKHEKIATNLFKFPKKNQPKTQKREADRFVGTAKPKHLYSGKRTNGKTDRR